MSDKNKFSIIEGTLASAVADDATFTASYPTGTDSSDFLGSTAHKLVLANNDVLTSPNDFTLTFGASNITVTNKSERTWAADTTYILQANKSIGTVDADEFANMQNVRSFDFVEVDLGKPVVADIDSLIKAATTTELPNATSATFTFPGSASPIDGVSSDGILDVPRNIRITQTATTTAAATATVTGKDQYGSVMVEDIAFAGSVSTSETVDGVKAFKEVTSIVFTTAVDMTSGYTVNIGVGDRLGLPFFLGDVEEIVGFIKSGELLGGLIANRVRVPFQIDETDVLAGTPISVQSPVDGTILNATTMVWKAIGTGGDITVNVGGTAVDGLTVTVADAAAAGVIDTDTPTAGHATARVEKDDEIEIVCASEFATSGAITGFVEIQVGGDVSIGVDAEVSATTADVRGYIEPADAPDGTNHYKLLVRSNNVKYLGAAQYAG